jgi:hypothetical protein
MPKLRKNARSALDTRLVTNVANVRLNRRQEGAHERVPSRSDTAYIPLPSTEFDRKIMGHVERIRRDIPLDGPIGLVLFERETTDTQAEPKISRLHVEPLLDQAREYLERAIADRARFNDLATKAFRLRLEIEEFTRLDKIHTDEVGAGAYTVPYQASAKETDADSTASKFSSNALATSKRYLSYLADKFNEIVNLRRFLSFVNAGPVESFDGDYYTYSLPADYGGVQDKLHQSSDLETRLAETEETIRSFGAQLQDASVGGQAAALQSKAAAGQIKTEWLLRNIEFRTRRYEVAKILNQHKILAAVKSGGNLNYMEQMRAVEARANANLNAAFARLTASIEVLGELYGFREPLPSYSTDHQIIDECYLWTFRATDWVLRLARSEQNSVVQVSVRRMVSAAHWANGIRSGHLTIPIRDEQLAGLRYARLRGVAGWVLLSQLRGSFSATLTPPTRQIYIVDDERHLDLGDEISPKIRLGRMIAYEPGNSADIVGAVVLHNRALLGEWLIELQGYSTGQVQSASIEDVLLDFHIAYR